MSPDLSDLVGIPFVEGGRTKEGADCYGIFVLAMERFGIFVPPAEVAPYASGEVNEAFREQVWRKRLWIPVSDPAAGDAVAMRNDPDLAGLVQHFGVYLGGGKFIHTLEKTGSIISGVEHPFWKNRIAGFYRPTEDLRGGRNGV